MFLQVIWNKKIKKTSLYVSDKDTNEEYDNILSFSLKEKVSFAFFQNFIAYSKFNILYTKEEYLWIENTYSLKNLLTYFSIINLIELKEKDLIDIDQFSLNNNLPIKNISKLKSPFKNNLYDKNKTIQKFNSIGHNSKSFLKSKFTFIDNEFNILINNKSVSMKTFFNYLNSNRDRIKFKESLSPLIENVSEIIAYISNLNELEISKINNSKLNAIKDDVVIPVIKKEQLYSKTNEEMFNQLYNDNNTDHNFDDFFASERTSEDFSSLSFNNNETDYDSSVFLETPTNNEYLPQNHNINLKNREDLFSFENDIEECENIILNIEKEKIDKNINHDENLILFENEYKLSIPPQLTVVSEIPEITPLKSLGSIKIPVIGFLDIFIEPEIIIDNFFINNNIDKEINNYSVDDILKIVNTEVSIFENIIVEKTKTVIKISKLKKIDIKNNNDVSNQRKEEKNLDSYFNTEGKENKILEDLALESLDNLINNNFQDLDFDQDAKNNTLKSFDNLIDTVDIKTQITEKSNLESLNKVVENDNKNLISFENIEHEVINNLELESLNKVVEIDNQNLISFENIEPEVINNIELESLNKVVEIDNQNLISHENIEPEVINNLELESLESNINNEVDNEDQITEDLIFNFLNNSISIKNDEVLICVENNESIKENINLETTKESISSNNTEDEVTEDIIFNFLNNSISKKIIEEKITQEFELESSNNFIESSFNNLLCDNNNEEESTHESEVKSSDNLIINEKIAKVIFLSEKEEVLIIDFLLVVNLLKDNEDQSISDLNEDGNYNFYEEYKKKLIDFTTEGDIESVEELYAHYPDFEQPLVNFNYEGDNPLCIASFNENIDLLKVLIDNGWSADYFDSNMNNALIVAAAEGHKHIVRYLLTQPYQINFQNKKGYTALHFAVNDCNHRIVRLLIEAGADFDLADNDRNTALSIAAFKGDINSTKILLETRMNVHVKNKKGYDARSIALIAKNHAIAKLIEEKIVREKHHHTIPPVIERK